MVTPTNALCMLVIQLRNQKIKGYALAEQEKKEEKSRSSYGGI